MQDPNTPLSMEHYRGVYMLQEKVSRGKERVNVTKFDGSKDLSGEQPGGGGDSVCHCRAVTSLISLPGSASSPLAGLCASSCCQTCTGSTLSELITATACMYVWLYPWQCHFCCGECAHM